MPAIGALNHPTARGMLFSHPRFFSTMRDVADVAARPHVETNVWIIVALVQTKVLPCTTGRRAFYDTRIQHSSQLGLVVIVGTRQAHRQRYAVSVYVQMAFGSKFGAICRVFSYAIAPFTGADTVALSTACHAQSIPCNSSYSFRQHFQSRPNTPCRTHFWKWACATEPEPYSRGIIFHWHPVRNTYKMPLKTSRCGVGGRPPLRERTSAGINRSAICQNSSGRSRQPALRGKGWRCSVRRAMLGRSSLPPLHWYRPFPTPHFRF